MPEGKQRRESVLPNNVLSEAKIYRYSRVMAVQHKKEQVGLRSLVQQILM